MFHQMLEKTCYQSHLCYSASYWRLIFPINLQSIRYKISTFSGDQILTVRGGTSMSLPGILTASPVTRLTFTVETCDRVFVT